MPLSDMPTAPPPLSSGSHATSTLTSPPSCQGAGTAMAIWHARSNPPRPLPPPPHIPELYEGRDLGWRWGNDVNASDFGRPASTRCASRLLDGPTRDDDPLARDFRRGSSASTIMPTDAVSSSLPSSNPGLQSERVLEQWTYEVRRASSKSYDTQLLGRFDGPSSPKRPSVSSLPEIVFPNSPDDSTRRHSSLRPFGPLHERRHASLDSAASFRLSDSGTNSPRSTGPWLDGGSPGALHYRSHDEAGSHKGSYDHSMFHRDNMLLEEGNLGNLVLYDRGAASPRSGSKRRASSPPQDEREGRSSVSSASVSCDMNPRRAMQPAPLPSRRGCPIQRSHPNHSSLSSVSSSGPRSGSLASSLGLASQPSSATSCGSGRFSPGAVSPTAELDLRLGVVTSGTKNAALPPTTSHQRTMSESTQGSGARHLSTSDVSHSRQSRHSSGDGGLVCECCPKKPKKFSTIEALRLHESEKQYSCQYCPNRFKNKNEAERHQMSLHLRTHSWSCAALPGPEAAFHPSPSNPAAADVCGYCGLDFPNQPNPRWDARAEHLRAVHKFRDCNADRKFFRADHFRQHLKHSHAGASGKWTSRLETACMQAEPVPIPTADAPPRPSALRSLSALALGTTDLSPPSVGS